MDIAWGTASAYWGWVDLCVNVPHSAGRNCVVGVIVKLVCGTGEMTQTSKALSVLPENPGSIPSIHMVA